MADFPPLGGGPGAVMHNATGSVEGMAVDHSPTAADMATQTRATQTLTPETQHNLTSTADIIPKCTGAQAGAVAENGHQQIPKKDTENKKHPPEVAMEDEDPSRAAARDFVAREQAAARQPQPWAAATAERRGASMADVLKNGQPSLGPIVLDPAIIKPMGVVGEREGKPSIYFSPTDNDSLAGRLGHAVIGKFSHSIPSTHHIQKALGNLKLVGSLSWKFLNAKHIFIQLSDLSDYVKLLNGPNGLPVWYIEQHPMRVFKWTPDFDPFFESPIVAVWCNLHALPVHLFDQSALYAIGKMLGNPIQVDRATSTRARISYARICVEIDISKPVVNEFVIDIAGRQITQKVFWDKIPAFCTDCKHVGHSTDTCYAFGKRERPPKKDYGQGWHRAIDTQAQKAKTGTAEGPPEKEIDEVQVTTGIRDKREEVRLREQQGVDEDGFQLAARKGRRRGRGGRHGRRRASTQHAEVSGNETREELTTAVVRTGSASPVGQPPREEMVGEYHRVFGETAYPCGDIAKWYSEVRMNNAFEMLSEGEQVGEDEDLLDESGDEGMEDTRAIRQRPSEEASSPIQVATRSKKDGQPKKARLAASTST